MTVTVDYYLAPVSPWTYLGGERFAEILRRSGARARVRPINLAKVFPATGGLPLKKRSPERQAYRFMELARWRDYLQMPLVLEPRYFPTDADPASLMIIAARERQLDALALSQRFLRAVWVDELDIARRDTIVALADELGLDGAALAEESESSQIRDIYEADTSTAIERGVFGVPTYAIGEQLYWGQDRLDFVERALV